MRFAFIDVEKAQFPVGLLCELLEVSRSGYYAWKGRPEPARVQADAALLAEIKTSHRAARGIYGSPRVFRDLKAKGRRVGEKRVARLMREAGISARRKKRFRRTTDSNHKHPIAPNVLARKFDVPLPNIAWVTDVTYVWTLEGWLYLAAILDLFSRRVVGWATSPQNDRALASAALERAIHARTPAAGWLHHSDRGSVYASNDYTETLEKLGAERSMSRKADCWDNAVAESFFATIKGEMIDHETFETRAQATAAIGEYVEGFYNPYRRHSAIGYVSPIEFELKFRQKQMAA